MTLERRITIMTDARAKVCHYTDIPAQLFGDEAPGVTIRWIIDEENDGAPNYALRVIEVAPEGHTPHHAHPFEHENFILEGKGRLQIEEEWHDLGPGDVAFVPANITHTYVNAGDAPFRFLCGIPVSRLIPKA
jgi:quercetin dioxygenase-like cupin family protein